MIGDLSRRQLFAEALHRGLIGLLRGVLEARHELAEWGTAVVAPLSDQATPSFDLVANLRELDRELRLKYPEYFPDDMPDPRDSEALERWIQEYQVRRRRERKERLAGQPLAPDVAPGDPPD